jgi:hypothetical protein
MQRGASFVSWIEHEMANWKRLTTVDDITIDVNMDQVCFMTELKDHTVLHFPAGREDTMLRSVKERLDEIHLKQALRSM